MAISIYDHLVVPMTRMLTNLDRIVGKAEQYADEQKIDPDVLVQGRLYPNMLPFVGQVRIATDTAKGAAARLTGTENPKWPDEERTFADIHARIAKATGFLATFRAEQFEGADRRNIELKLGSHEVRFTGTAYITGYVMPNFYFHVTTAYAILRHNGLAIGKADFLGGA